MKIEYNAMRRNLESKADYNVRKTNKRPYNIILVMQSSRSTITSIIESIKRLKLPRELKSVLSGRQFQQFTTLSLKNVDLTELLLKRL